MSVSEGPDGRLVFEAPTPKGQKCPGCCYLAWFGFVLRCAHPERSCFAMRCEDFRPWGDPRGPLPVPLGMYASEWFDAIAVARIRESKPADPVRRAA